MRPPVKFICSSCKSDKFLELGGFGELYCSKCNTSMMIEKTERKPPVKFIWRGIHHGYLGAWFVGFGAFFLYMNQGNMLDAANYLYASFIAVGAYMVVDDLVEHLWTEDTPLRVLWNMLLHKKEWW